jgi:putative salt-induced outer membrane protein YdiY
MTPGSLFGDEVRTTDGSVLQGTVSAISKDTLTIQTALFGTLSISRDKISSLSTDHPASVRLDDGSVQVGAIRSTEPGKVEISGALMSGTVDIARVQEFWPQGAEDPRETALKAAADALKRSWKADASAAANGNSGNTSQKNLSAGVDAVLTGPADELKLYGRYTSDEADGEESANETVGGVKYSAYGEDWLGWYVRTEMEQDEFENIDLRVTSAGGLSYRWVNKKDYKLSGNTGLSYRHESYNDGSENTGAAGLDFGLSHLYRFKHKWEIKNELTCTPSVEDFSSYLVSQDSSLSLPIGGSKWWKIKLGLRNDYNSLPADDRKALDTTWYSALAVTKE